MNPDADFGMSFYEMIQSMGLNLNTALTMMQFWVSVTFGLVVAFHFAGDRLTRPMVVLAIALYLGTTLVMIGAYVQSGISMAFWAEAGELTAIERGLMTREAFQTNALVRNLTLISGGVLMLAGTAATIYYGAHIRRKAAATEAAPEKPADGEPPAAVNV
jgi:hypothetical protein